MTAEQKTFKGRLVLKADEGDEKGTFKAVFATMDVVDLDGDVTLPGAFGKQTVLVEPWNHNYQELPVGRGVISEDDHDAVLDGKFFLDTVSGAEHYQVVKALADIQEWSYTFTITEAEFGKFEGRDVRFLKKLDVWGVGPVTRGAGIDTRVTDIKGKKPTNTGGQTGNGAPSGVGVAVVRAKLDLLELED